MPARCSPVGTETVEKEALETVSTVETETLEETTLEVGRTSFRWVALLINRFKCGIPYLISNIYIYTMWALPVMFVC